jgi:hypothetical protein
MDAAGSMEVPALVRGPRKDVRGSLRPTCVTGDIPRTREKRRVDAAKDRAIKKEIRQIERELIAIK